MGDTKYSIRVQESPHADEPGVFIATLRITRPDGSQTETGYRGKSRKEARKAAKAAKEKDKEENAER